MATFKITRKTANGEEEVKFPMSVIEGLEETLRGSRLKDLADTTWIIPSGWSAEAGLAMPFVNYEVNVNDNPTAWECSQIAIGFEVAGNGSGIMPAVVDEVTFAFKADSIVLKTSAVTGYSVTPDDSLKITFKSGATTNTDLVNWVYTYGELYEEPIDLSIYQTREDENLNTESKEIVDAINEIYAMVNSTGEDVTDLLDTTWILNDTIPKYSATVNVTFVSGGNTYSAFKLMDANNQLVIMYDSTLVYYNGAWVDAKYQTVTFTGGDTTNSTLIDVMCENGKMQSEASNLATVDKVEAIYTVQPTNVVYDEYDGVTYELGYDMLNKLATKSYSSGNMQMRLPITEGENVTFTVEDGFIKINAKGGGSSENVVSKFTISTEPSTTVIDIINAIQNAGGNIGEWNVIVLKGYIIDTLGLQISHYGSDVYNIKGVNLTDMTTVSNIMSWSGISLGQFQVMFKDGSVPYCDETMEGQVLKVVNGVPTWTTL